MKNHKNKIRLITILIISSFNILASNNIISTHNLKMNLWQDSTIFSLNNINIIHGKIKTFDFPAYTMLEPNLEKAVFAQKKDEKLCLEFKVDVRPFSKLIDNKNKILQLRTDFYVKGGDSIYIELFNPDQNQYNHFITYGIFQNYTYQPTNIMTFNAGVISIKEDSTLIFRISTIPKDKSSCFAVGRFNGSVEISHTVEGCEYSVEQLSLEAIKDYPNPINESVVLFETPEFIQHFKGFTYTHTLELPQTKIDTISYIASFVDKLVQNYEIYDQSQKNEFKRKNNYYANDSETLDQYYKRLTELVNSLDNCHFRMNYKFDDEYGKVKQPILFYEIKNQVHITAVFDTILQQQAKAGDVLVDINNISTEDLFTLFKTKVSANTEHHRRFKITQRLLHLSHLHFPDTLRLGLKNTNGEYFKLEINSENFKSTYSLPPNFKTTSSTSSEMINEIVYLRFISSERYIVPTIYSQLENMKKSKGLIIDFRGISGGDFSIFNMLTFFINQMYPVMQTSSTQMDITKKSSNAYTYIVKPFQKYYYDKPIVFLVDPRTTCYAEIIVDFMKSVRKDIYVIGFNKTSGGAEHIQTVYLPNNASLHFFQGYLWNKDNQIIDLGGGTRPDIMVPIDSYLDLIPYNDKLKKYAIDFLREYSTYLNNN